MHRNLTLAKFLFPLNLAWFWLGIWVPYYLLFTNYAGIGLIETIVVLSTFLLELPTGAFTDLIGKKRTLHLVFIFNIIGALIMANASSFWHLLISVTFLGIGVSFISGTQDAFIYDTLLTIKKESNFETIRSQIQRYGLIVMAIASAIGGWMYTISPSLPFWAVAVAHTICLILTFYLKEPPIDSESFSLANYLKQMKTGLYQLFSPTHDTRWLLKLLIIGAFSKFLIEGIDPALALDFGVSDAQLGYLYAIIPLISAAGAYWYEKKSRSFSRQTWWYLVTVAIILGPLLSPLLGLITGISFLFIRNIFYPILDTMTASTINNFVESKSRATTLSAFNMIQSFPYVIGATFVGWLIDNHTVAITLAGLTTVFLLLYVIASLFPNSSKSAGVSTT